MDMGKTAKGIVYVSAWVVIWGTVASVVDFVLLGSEVYGSGSTGQATTFITYGIASAFGAWRLGPRFLKESE